MNESAAIAAIIVGLLASGVGLYALERARRSRALHRWAAAHEYKLIAFHQPMLTETSPFPFAMSKAQQVFHISVLQKDGNTKSGWILLGSGLRGLASSEAEVKWDT